MENELITVELAAEQGQIRTGITQAVCHPIPQAVLSCLPQLSATQALGTALQASLVTRYISDACQT